jgi:hypothetical protein
MKIISFQKGDLKCLAQASADSGLAATGYTHNNDDHQKITSLISATISRMQTILCVFKDYAISTKKYSKSRGYQTNPRSGSDPVSLFFEEFEIQGTTRGHLKNFEYFFSVCNIAQKWYLWFDERIHKIDTHARIMDERPNRKQWK